MLNSSILRVIKQNIEAGRITDAIDDLDLLEGRDVRLRARQAKRALELGDSRGALWLVEGCYGR